MDLGALEAAMRRKLRGQVRFDSAHRAMYSADASNYRQVPLGVVFPLDIDDLVEAVAVCREHGAPILHRGAGTSIAGQTVNEAVVIDGSRHLDRILEIDPERRIARVEPGVLRDQLNDITVGTYGLTFGPDTSTHAWATLGGMIGNNACGKHSEMAGTTAANVEQLEVLLYDGTRMHVGATPEDALERIIAASGRRSEIYRRLRALRDRYGGLVRERYPAIPRRISGYNLDELLPENGFHVARALVGSEGTLVTVLEATLKLVAWPPAQALLILAFDDVFAAGDHVAAVKEFGPTALEGMDRLLVQYLQEKDLHAEHLHLLPEGGGFLMVEFGGSDPKEAAAKARACLAELQRHGRLRNARLVEHPAEQKYAWEIRESALGAATHTKHGENWPGWEDSAVPPEAVGTYLRGLQTLYDRYGYVGSFYGHFGQGCVHTRPNFDLRTENGIRTFRRFLDEAAELCLRLGGSLSAEHGDGQARGELLEKMFGPELIEAFREFKSIFDPDWKMNPGKVIDANPITANLRIFEQKPQPVELHFRYPQDDGDLALAVTRCVGVGKCRRLDIGETEVMCPSYVATRDEMHTTRGRARLLFEMLHHGATAGPWQNEDVKEALDLCLACKGCVRDCPVRVDMATYKAEFLAHYFENKRRPRTAYAIGLIGTWARLAARAPRAASFLSRRPLASRIGARLAGTASERTLPRFAPETFSQWWRQRPRASAGTAGPRVLLWADTFTNHFEPNIAQAAVALLEHAGLRLDVPDGRLCCGRPLYEFGFLDLARKRWLEILEALGPHIEAGTPLVGLEPSCVAAFRDELVNLFPDRDDARRLAAQTFTLSELLVRTLPDYEPPRVDGRVMLHGHCHEKSVLDFAAQRELLKRAGAEVEVVPSGCCGMAGGFGYQRDHYEVSMACGEYRLFPAVREAAGDVVILADGFSCRSQIRDGTGRTALHLAQLLESAIREGA